VEGFALVELRGLVGAFFGGGGGGLDAGGAGIGEVNRPPEPLLRRFVRPIALANV